MFFSNEIPNANIRCVQLSVMGKREVKKSVEAMTIKCAKCGHIQANHLAITPQNQRDSQGGKLVLSKCKTCNCKEFKFKTKDTFKGFFQKK